MERKTPARKSPAPKKRTAKTAPATLQVQTRARAKKTASKHVPAPATPPAAPLAARPAPRRAVFIDVENTSSEHSLLAVLDHLKIDRTAQPTDLIAAGNWKSVGAKVARTLAGLGAQLVHSAPAVGVRDWSDLWIAVAAGRWLATAAPGDTIDIVSDDRAFDAVGDAAAAAGITFHRISYRSIPGTAQPATAVTQPVTRSRHHRGGRRHGRAASVPLHAHGPARPVSPPAVVTPAAATASEVPAAASSASAQDEAHAASLEHIRATLARLSGGTGRWINLDTIANALREEGFTRPPGSPRLVTRLRALKDVEVTSSGMVRFVGEASQATAGPTAAVASQPRRPRRRGGRGRRRGTPTATPVPSGTAEGEVSP